MFKLYNVTLFLTISFELSFFLIDKTFYFEHFTLIYIKNTSDPGFFQGDVCYNLVEKAAN